MMIYDVTIIGAGIIGTLLAHELSKYDLKVLVLEKNNDVACGASGANSAMIHSGHDPKPDTLKCKYNLEGNRMYPSLCEELKVSYKNTGAFVVACGEEEEKKLDVLVEQCINRDIPFELMDGDNARTLEPNLSDNITKVLSLPTTGIVTPWEVCYAAIEEAMLNETELRLNYKVETIKKKRNYFLINKEIQTQVIVNCAGVACDDVASMVRRKVPYKVEGKKGEYYVLDHSSDMFVNHIIYPVPSKKGKGVLVVPTTHKNILLGPSSDLIKNKNDTSTMDGLDYVKVEVSKTVKNIPYNRMIRNFAGVRASIDLDDFYIQEDNKVENFIHIAGIESPGLTAAPAIAKDVCENIILPKFDYKERFIYVRREPVIKMNEMSDKERDELIKTNPDYGKIICRCENISLGEIKDSIHRKCGATTIKGVKMRCRPGMGRCQGSFCESEVFKILKQELNKDIKDIEYSEPKSRIASSIVKENL